jgi:SAM-dependent methyltransferase
MMPRHRSDQYSVFSSRRLIRKFILNEVVRFSEQVKNSPLLGMRLQDGSLQLLDIGCGERPYAQLFNAKQVGADVYFHAGIDVVARAEDLPFRDESFDVAICTQVLEHLADPVAMLNNTHRVLKQGGLLFLSTHGIWLEKHEKSDYWRWTLDGLVKLVAGAGFQVVCQSSMKPLESLMQLLALYTPSGLYPFHVSLNLLGSLFGKVFGSRGPRLYIDHALVCRKG